MNKQEFNRLAAELLELMDMHIREDTGELLAVIPVRGYSVFNPYDDANDMLLLEMGLRINTTSLEDGSWISCFPRTSGYGKTPHESRRACAEEYLKEWKK